MESCIIKLSSSVFNLSTLSVVLSVLATLFGFFLFSIKSTNRLGNRLLGFYFLLVAIDFSAYYSNITISLDMFRNDLSFVSKPFIYLYVLSVLYSDFKLQKRHLLHAIWFIIVVTIMIPWYFAEESSQIHFLRNYLDYNEGKFIFYFSLIQTQVYIIAIFILLVRHKKILVGNYSNPNLTNYKWLMQMTLMLEGFFLFVFIKNMCRVFSCDTDVFENSRILLVVFTIIFLCWLLLKALHSPQIFRGLDSNLKRFGRINIEAKPKHVLAKQVEELEFYMTTNEPFLNPELSIQSLADGLDIPIRDLSELINYHYKQNFYNFINAYRISMAKKLLSDPTSKNLTISEIFYKIGFNSKSSFNTAFKKEVGITPTDFRKSHE